MLLNACATTSSSGGSQQLRRIGYITPSSRFQPDGTTFSLLVALVEELRTSGWIEGRNLAVEARFADGRSDLLPQLAAELVRAEVEIIVAQGTPPIIAAKEQTTIVPIVMAPAADPVSAGLVASLARPGGNITGVALEQTALAVKGMELLKAVVPSLARLAIMWDSSNAGSVSSYAVAHRTAHDLGLDVLELDVRAGTDVRDVLGRATQWGVDGLLTISGGACCTGAALSDLPAVVAQRRLPAMHVASANTPSGLVARGDLMSYSTQTRSMNRLIASYIDKLLRGAKPADLPVEQVREFDFAVNVKAAEALGLSIPPDVAAQVTEWVQ
jgi:putative ABC transport system substrate-binding protein